MKSLQWCVCVCAAVMIATLVIRHIDRQLLTVILLAQPAELKRIITTLR